MRELPAMLSGPPAGPTPPWTAAFMKPMNLIKEADVELVDTRPVERQPNHDVRGYTDQIKPVIPI